MKPIVVTGFEPFGGLDYNPSSALLELLPRSIAGHPVHTAVLPVDASRITRALEALPLDGAALLLHTGLAGDRPVISIERVALNLLDFRLPDNAGRLEVERPVIDGAPLALATRLPVRRILDAWSAAGIPGISSTTAGTFLCNQCLFLSLAHRPPELPVGFLHLAPDERLAMSGGGAHQLLAIQAAAAVIAIEVTLAEAGDGAAS